MKHKKPLSVFYQWWNELSYRFSRIVNLNLRHFEQETYGNDINKSSDQ